VKPPKHPLPLSRRLLLGAPSAVALSPGIRIAAARPVAPSDPIAAIAKRWSAVKQSEADLLARWSKVEARLLKDFRWADLTDEEQQALPEAKELYAIDAQLDTLEEERRNCRGELVSLPAVTLRHLLVKLEAVIGSISPADNCAAHHLLAVAIEELGELIQASTVI
jgi:hypothetical protein